MNFQIVSDKLNESHTIPVSGIPLINTEVRGFSPSQLISFVDLTSSVLENNPAYNVYEKLLPVSTSSPLEYSLPQKYRGYGSGCLLVTDRSTESKLVDFTLPLYHQYQLMYDYYIMDPALPNGFITVRKNMESVVSYDNYVLEIRPYPTISGRYINSFASGFLWGKSPISGNAITARLLLPLREKDNFYTVEYNKYLNGTITEYHNELIYEKPLYIQNRDYTITPSSIILTGNSNIGSGSMLFVQRSPDTFINIKQPIFTNDSMKVKPWNFQVSCGSFIHSSGILGGVRSYKVTNYHTDINNNGQVAPAEIPQIINKNIIKVGVTPLLESTSGYPSYDISHTIVSGNINGSNIIDKITSIDYNNGYIYLDQNIQTTDSINVIYNYDDKKTILVNNLDLNPKNTISGTIDIAINPIGIAIVPSGTIFNNALSGIISWSNIVYYSSSSNPTNDFDSIPTTGYALECLSDVINGGPISGIIPSGSKSLGLFTLNSISDNMVKVTDVRRTGGFIESDVTSTVSGWRGFSDIGYWDGEAFPKAGTILIQIPIQVLYNITNIFTSNNNYTEVTSQYTPDLTNIIEPNTHKYESRKQQLARDVKKYIRDTIERYLPVGCLYIIVDENFNPWPSIRSDS